jgi:UDP-glucuronate 4-epimerase
MQVKLPPASAKLAPGPVLITGVAGFVGAALAQRLLAMGVPVVGLDNLNDYYDVRLKRARLTEIDAVATAHGTAWAFHELDLIDLVKTRGLFVATKPAYVVHLAAQAGVRYGLINQVAFLESNLMGHFSVQLALKALAEAGHPVAHYLYASSSSVYGNQSKTPFDETDDVSKPLSLYAATKRANELVSYAWANQFGTPSTALRFFTVYGPWGRPDMSPMLFAKAILDGAPIPLFNGGDLWRDFTFVDDIVEALVRLLPVVPLPIKAALGQDLQPAKGGDSVPHRILNLGNQNPVQLHTYVKLLGEALGKEPVLDLKDWPPTEVYQTFANTQELFALAGWRPSTPLAEGLQKFAAWYAPRHGSIVV